MKHLLAYLFLFTTALTYANGLNANNLNNAKKIKITGTVLDAESGEPLEYATLVLQSVADPSKVTGGITDAQGKFNVSADAGNYNIRVEYISFKTYEAKEQVFQESTDLGIIKLSLACKRCPIQFCLLN